MSTHHTQWNSNSITAFNAYKGRFFRPFFCLLAASLVGGCGVYESAKYQTQQGMGVVNHAYELGIVGTLECERQKSRALYDRTAKTPACQLKK